ncbi:hypothetical protein BABINDRAFT_162751 [Babjeviella inositovora NRRL Y-12698]|uniref:Purine-cytosine permease n=1 Tax=Babjeviella inositovora NRRL Y-12698 TaxID=984486 RepID=A0A1E3QLH1_9ASCO|nr:uncharacterized protein BABINDRAFT_162751 [Babjeviella inositovora NRRL Y-12698]ODQ78546.1 hypothetical protein BABINDRAFT_162751 [Babjeviella inositovora NRRL Y-12698]
MSDLEKQYIPEKTDLPNSYQYENDSTSVEVNATTATETRLTFNDRVAQMFHAETRGVEIVPDEEKIDSSIWTAASMWFSANFVIATFSLGALGHGIWDLNFGTSCLTIVFFSILGVIPVALFSVFGAKFGLRQLILSRFLVGNFTARIFAFINVIACVGWGAVNIMVSAQLLHSINGGVLPPWAGCLILVVCTIIVTFFGYNVIHMYEKWSWVPNLFSFLIVLARMKISGNFTQGEWTSGPTTAGGVLSFGGAIFGFATGWTTYAADYTVYMPKNTSSLKIFVSVVLGCLIPTWFCMILGAACVMGIDTSARWKELYDTQSIGGLIFAILVEDSLGKFGEFVCVLLAMSTVANNIPNMYSLGLSAQSFHSSFEKVPRVVWTICGNFVTLAICIPAYYHFSDVMSNFMNLIAYYLAIYQAIAYSEHVIYRKGFANYDPTDYNQWDRLPLGIAGTFAFCCGVVGCVLGMGQVWYTGVIAKKIGEFGGDIGFELGACFAFVAYNATRWAELKYYGR